MLQNLQNIFREVFDDPELVVSPETGVADVDGWDSVAQVKLVLAIEERFDVQLSNDDVSSIRTVGGFLEALGRAGVAVEPEETEAEPDDELGQVRRFLNEGCDAEAIAECRAALEKFPPYSFFVRGEKLFERLMESPQWQPRRRVKAALLSSSTTALLAPVLRAVGLRVGIHFDLYEGVYGNYRQEILDPNSALHRFRPDFALLILNHRDVQLPPSGGKTRADEFVHELRGLWQTLRERSGCHIVQLGIDAPPGGGWASLETVLPEGRRRLIRSVNQALSENLPSGASWIDAEEIAAEVGPGYWSDSQWHAAKQYPASDALPRLADHLVSHCAAVLGLSAKVLAVDLDNTLWGGVIGEDLLGGIRIGPPTAEGEGFVELQQYLKELQERGVLLAVCSKNNRDDAELPFRRHDAMLLKLDDFAAFTANWQDKPTNLIAIADALSLGLDSFVFLDDNPMERGLVRRQLPQVVVPECGSTPWEMLAALRRGLYFQSVSLTQEDIRRHETYRNNAARTALEQSAGSLEEFLAGLEMKSDHGPINAATLVRTTQLINKTNQFNLTTRRYTEEQVRAMADSKDWWCRWFRLSDRFGDHGLIGVILARRDKTAWTIDTWLMSCRVLGRKMEDFMASVLLSAAQSEGAQAVGGRYLPTAKNAVVQNLYAQLGFEACPDQPGTFRFDFRKKRPPGCDFIRGPAHAIM